MRRLVVQIDDFLRRGERAAGRWTRHVALQMRFVSGRGSKFPIARLA